MVQEVMGASYIDILSCQFYPLFLIMSCAVIIQLGLLRTKIEKNKKLAL